MNIKELLENEEIREALEQELQSVLESRVAELEASKKELEDKKKQVEREAFIARKALVHKVGLYEKHLREHYEAQFDTFAKKLASDTFTYVQENLDGAIKAVASDAKANSKAVQIQEALSSVVRVLAPHMDLNEALKTSNVNADGLKAELNAAHKAIKALEASALKKDIETQIVKESADLPAEDRKIFIESLTVMAPKTIAEVSVAAKNVKQVIEKRRAEAVLEAANQMLTNGTKLAEGAVKVSLPAAKKSGYDFATALTSTK